MSSELPNKLPFKVKCTDNDFACLTIGKKYDVIEVDGGYYKVKHDNEEFKWYHNRRFEIVKTPQKDKQEFSVGDNVVVNRISDDYIPLKDKNVKVGDVATVTWIENHGNYEVRLTNQNWKNAWWFSRNDLSLADNSSNYNLLSPQEVVQATLDGKELEMQYKDGTWDSISSVNTTLHQLTTLNFRLKPETPLEDKRKAVIKKLLATKVAVLCKCWDDDDVDYIGKSFEAVTSVDDNYAYPYMNNCLAYKNAFAIDDNGNEITNVE